MLISLYKNRHLVFKGLIFIRRNLKKEVRRNYMSLIKDNKTTNMPCVKRLSFWFCSSRYGSCSRCCICFCRDEVASATTTVTSTTATQQDRQLRLKKLLYQIIWRLRKQMRRLLDLKLQKQRQTQADEKTAEQDYAKQAIAMDKTVADYKAEIAANQATYEKEKAVVDAKMQRLRQLMTRKLKPITKSKLQYEKQ